MILGIHYNLYLEIMVILV